MSLRERWMNEVSWSEGVFNSLEKFVDTASESEREQFIRTGNGNDLFSDRRRPSPIPSKKHVKYMHEYAEEQYS